MRRRHSTARVQQPTLSEFNQSRRMVLALKGGERKEIGARLAFDRDIILRRGNIGDWWIKYNALYFRECVRTA